MTIYFDIKGQAHAQGLGGDVLPLAHSKFERIRCTFELQTGPMTHREILLVYSNLGFLTFLLTIGRRCLVDLFMFLFFFFNSFKLLSV